MPQDFNAMQAQAIQYAQEMQKKASLNTIRTNTEAVNKHQFHQTKDIFSSPEQGFGNKNSRSQERETPFCQSACPIKNILNSSNTKKGNDNDIMLLMALLLVLSQDGGDKMLMLALLYIMT